MTWPDDAVRARLVGDWHIYQRTGGHRTSTDDVITAWHACRDWNAPPSRYLDLGCGIGSVLLTVAWRLKPAFSLGVEAQAQSVQLLRRALEELPSDAPLVHVENSDFRSIPRGHHSLSASGSGSSPSPRNTSHGFVLITGSPPYFPLGTGVHPNDPQRLACRFETRGGVEDYCAAAARYLADDGRFHLVFQTKWNERVEAAGANAGLHLAGRCDFRSRSDRPEPFLTVYEFRRSATSLQSMSLAVRDRNGDFTPEFVELRRELGY